MAHIPQSILDRQPVFPGLDVLNRGKVGISFALPGYPHHLLAYRTNQISIFDFVLPGIVPQKGEVLNALSNFWVTEVLGDICKTDLSASGTRMLAMLPSALADNNDILTHATIIDKLTPPDVEDIVRLHLTGSGWSSYQKNRTVCGHLLPADLGDGNELPYPLYTPTTKATEGHDEHISADSVSEKYGARRERLAIKVACLIAKYAKRRGIILADTKFEFSLHQGQLILVDEKGTPDSSRFWDRDAWEKAQGKGKLPPSFDKQFVREWGKTVGIDKLDPTNPEHLAFVEAQSIPESVIRQTTRLYRYIFWRLTGMQLETYQREKMGILSAQAPKRRIEVLIGSASDESQIRSGLEVLRNSGVPFRVNVLSCHRNPAELRKFVREVICETADVVIAGAGMAAALPGIVKSDLCSIERSDIPVIGVAFKGADRDADRAATLSLEQLPEKPVELGREGKAHFGHIGFINACLSAVRDEFLPRSLAPKPAQIDYQVTLGG